jgi:hypothetical protein
MADPASLIFENEAAPAAAGVHAIVIGIGHYRHFPGGTGNRYADHAGMVQLSSPPHSARHITDWLFKTYHADTKLPLRSVHLLISKPGGTASYTHRHCPRTEVPEASLNNIDTAVTDWFARGDRLKENLLLFYFCGHGISAGDQHTLLCTDFGSNPLAPFKHAIDFTDFHLGMARCKADAQMFLVDACRTISQDLIEQASSHGQSLVEGNLTVTRRAAPVFRSAQPGKAAYGLPGKPSAFAQAVPLAFLGGAWDKVDGEWVVCTSMLRRALERQISRVMRKFPRYNSSVAGDADITMTIKHPEGDPIVPVDIGGRPPADHSVAELGYQAPGGGSVRQQSPDEEVWLLDLEEGMYEFFAKFRTPTGGEQIVQMQKYVTPQNVSERLKVP